MYLFSEENIQRLFGHEAAEDEDPARLKEYYFKNPVYERVTANLPLRILVGNKGIGKSALFKMAMADDYENRRFSLLIRPNDITHLGKDSSDFLQTIREWEEGLTKLIMEKTHNALGIYDFVAPTNLHAIANRNEGIVTYLLSLLLHLDVEGEVANRMKENYLTQHQIIVYIDDLDRGWEGRGGDISRISALINAVRDIMNNNRTIKFRISLRSDVYYLYRKSDESTDKTKSSVVWLSWSNHELFVMLLKRIETFFERSVDEERLLSMKQTELAHYLDPVMARRFWGYGRWSDVEMHQVLMSLIRNRPRDLVSLCTLAAQRTQKRKGNKIETVDFNDIFEAYSRSRIDDTVIEYISELPNIENLLMSMKPNKRERVTKAGYVYTTGELKAKLDNISNIHKFKFTNGETADAPALTSFLYKINFITARKETDRGIVRKSYEDNQFLSSGSTNFGFDWEVHPAYRWALQPSTIDDIFRELELNADD
jgi:hypothetical protein